MVKVYKPLFELGRIVTGKTPKTNVVDYWGGNIPFITPTDIVGYNSYYQYETERYVTKKGLDTQKATLLPANSVCFSCIASIGKACLTRTFSITNQQINSIIPNDKNDYRYILYLLRYNLPYVQMIAGGSGSGTPIISKRKFEKFKFIIEDDLKIQHRIASILSAYDSLIENNTKRIRLLEKMAENLYKEWFVRFRFPGYEKAEMENGLPKGWKVERVFDIADVMYGYAFKSNHFCDNPALNPVVRIRDIQNNHTNTFTDEECEEKYLIKRNAILIGMDGLFHMCLWNGERAFLNQRVVMLNSKKVDFCNYLLFMAIHPQIKYWEQVISGTTVAHLGDKHLKRVQVIVPSTEILSKANSLIARIMGKKNILLRQNSLLARRRDLLLPRLMSGKLEVKP